MIRFLSIGFLLSLFLVGSALAQTYEEKRQYLLNKQSKTRAEINVLDTRIKTYQNRIQQNETRFEKLYRQCCNNLFHYIDQVH